MSQRPPLPVWSCTLLPTRACPSSPFRILARTSRKTVPLRPESSHYEIFRTYQKWKKCMKIAKGWNPRTPDERSESVKNFGKVSLIGLVSGRSALLHWRMPRPPHSSAVPSRSTGTRWCSLTATAQWLTTSILAKLSSRRTRCVGRCLSLRQADFMFKLPLSL